MKGTWKALAFLAAIAGVALALSTSAFASAAAPARRPPEWGLSLAPAGWSGRLAALYPGARARRRAARLHGHQRRAARQRLSRVAASVPATRGGDAETAAGGDIRGCRANWFAVVVDRANRPLPV